MVQNICQRKICSCTHDTDKTTNCHGSWEICLKNDNGLIVKKYNICIKYDITCYKIIYKEFSERYIFY